MSRIITFDFDDTLIDATEGNVIKPGLQELQSCIEDGHEIHIVTFRKPEWSVEIYKFIEEHKLKIESVVCTSLTRKLQFLLNLKSSRHYDDDLATLIDCHMHGIEPVLMYHGFHLDNVTTEIFTNRIDCTKF